MPKHVERWAVIGLAVILLTIAKGSSKAETTPRELSPPSNAALAYWRAWSSLPPELHKRVLETFNGRDLAWSPAEVLSDELESARPSIELLQRAAAIESCDWGPDNTMGVERDLPHLEKLRETSRLFVSDCRRLLAAGRLDESVDRAEALFRMSLHTRSDRGAQSSAVGQGFALMACDEVQRFIDHTPLTAAHRERLVAALRPLDAPDPFAFADAVAFEGLLLKGYVARRFTGDSAGRDFFMAIQRGGEPDAVVRELTALNASSLFAAADKVASYFDSVGSAWAEPDAPARLADLQRRVLAGDYAPLGLLVCPGYAGAREASTAARARIHNALELLALPPRRPEDLKPLPKHEPTPSGPPAP